MMKLWTRLGLRVPLEFHWVRFLLQLLFLFLYFSGRSRRKKGDALGSSNGGDNGGLDDFRRDEENSDSRDDTGGGECEGEIPKNIWIMKPVGMSRGRGIRLIDDIKKISYADKVREKTLVCQGWSLKTYSLVLFH